MSGKSSAVADVEVTKLGDSSDSSPAMKKPKIDPMAESDAEFEKYLEAEKNFVLNRRPFLPHNNADPNYREQSERFIEQVEKTKGYYMDLDVYDYKFAPIKFEWGVEFDLELSNEDLMDLLIKTAIDEENEEYGGQIEFVKYVSANVTAAEGYCFYITLLAKDLSSPNPQPQLYQTMVRKFCDEIVVHEFKLKPTEEG